MCGLIGICKREKLNTNEIENIRFVSSQLNHRGPNQSGEWFSEKENILFSHRRLSINDLSEDGKQPMESNCGRYTLVFNGEAYNFLKIKEQLEYLGYKFKSNSDTEVVLRLIENFGFEQALTKINGMFALALYDKKFDKIFLGRDQNGQKPIYYHQNDNFFFFTSELRNIDKIIKNLKISKKALQYFFQLSYVPEPLSIYENIFKLKKGHFLVFDIKNFSFKIESYNLQEQKLNLDNLNFNQKIKKFENILLEATNDHLISDVKNGTLLSGGIDSTIITYAASRVSLNKIDTFCVKSNDKNYDESDHAIKTASQIGTNHHTLEFSQDDLFQSIINIHKVYDEPFGDSSQIPTYLLFKSINDKIKVALSGDGGDELFYGYNRYEFLNKHYDKIKILNRKFRFLMSDLIKMVPESTYDNFNKILKLNYSNLGNKFHKIANSLKFKNLEEFYFQIIRQDLSYNNLVNTKIDERNSFLDLITFKSNNSNLKNFQNMDIKYYLSDDIFVKVDRASMYNSIECRAPFLDNRIVSFSDQLKDNDKIYDNQAKYFLKEFLKIYMPTTNFNRPKMGFGNPIGKWLNNELKAWANNLILTDNDKISKYINTQLIEKLWILHQKEKVDYSTILWNFLIFKNWLNINEII